MRYYDKPWIFRLLALQFFILIAASVVGHLFSTEVAHTYFYAAPWTIFLWGMLAACGVYEVWTRRHVVRWAVVVLHAGLVLILCGAALSHFLSEEGRVQLSRENRITDAYLRKDQTVGHFPFSIHLVDYATICYPATNIPKDHTTQIRIHDGNNNASPLVAQCTMNHVVVHKNWRFCQLSISPNGTTLYAVSDPWGIGTTYAGYALLLIGSIAYLLQRKSAFRQLLSVATPEKSSSHRLRWQTIVLTVLSAVIIGALIVRAYDLQYFPCTNGYEVMLCIALCSAIIGAKGHQYSAAIQNVCLLIALATGICALSYQLQNLPSHLPPVLRSPLLSLHVSVIMIAYALLAIVTLLSLYALIALKGEEHSRKLATTVGFVRALLYPATLLLGIGIFIGAYWANQSWGNYWSWDPKETWALITLLTYVPLLHPRLFPQFAQSQRFLRYALCAFIAVLMTYFGVNYILGGLHSYA